MSKPKELSVMSNEILNYLYNLNIEENIQNILEKHKKKIKKEYTNIITEEKLKLLVEISEGEHISYETLKQKYMKTKELKNIDDKLKAPIIDESESILNKIEINNIWYYYEPKEGGKIYNNTSIHVGYYKNDEFILSL